MGAPFRRLLNNFGTGISETAEGKQPADRLPRRGERRGAARSKFDYQGIARARSRSAGRWGSAPGGAPAAEFAEAHGDGLGADARDGAEVHAVNAPDFFV